MDFLTWFAFGLIIFVVLMLAYGLIAIHDIPYLMAKSRNHPHQDAIHTAGWVSLFTLHAIWPFLWIWATSYHPEYGYRGKSSGAGGEQDPDISQRLKAVEERLHAIEQTSRDTQKHKA